jgi:hypothetical protein
MNSKLEMIEDWQEPNRKGIIYYLGDGRVRGVLLWGIFGKVDEARGLVTSSATFRPADLRGRIHA